MLVVIFFACLDVEQKSSFVNGHYLLLNNLVLHDRSVTISVYAMKFIGYYEKELQEKPEFI